MGAAEDPVNNTAGSTGSLENHATGHTENPIKDNVGSSENPVKDKAPGAENPVSNQAGNAEIPKASSAENPVSDQTDVKQIPGSGGRAENLFNDQAGGAENPSNDGEATGGAENSVKNKAGTSENNMNVKNDGIENPVNNNSDGVENHLSNQTDAAENLVNDKQDPAGSFVENKADALDSPINSIVKAVEFPASSKANAVESPASCKPDCLPEEAKEILISLASKWEDVLDANALQVFPLKGAMTNKVYQIKWPTTTGETSRKVLVRMYGEGVDVFFDRDKEIRTFEFMSKNGQGPLLLGRFTNGRVEEFIHARTLSASDLRDPSISALIAAKMKEFHELDMPGEKKVHLWDRLRNWLSEAKRLSSPKEVEAFYLDTIDKEISMLEKELSGADQLIGFCHNDLQYGNIMLDEETNSVTIIDYEYASYNHVAFDIANHFCEMAANYHTEEPHILDYTKYPDLEERRRFVKAYLSTSGEQSSDNKVEQLLQEIEKYTLANHLFWGVWGIISAQVNTIDFDYKEYAKQRFQEYWARKPYLLINTEAPPYNAAEGTGEQAPSGHQRRNSGIFRKMKKVLGLGLFRSKS
ncbi:probable choline kinase 2 [Cajanus cajan]|uniref:probable choline kinase 2 n=1 Tax=Cajanus cajan TaxID=3821 RepID=UPI00098DB7C1|nr:probable choline kinase 2 [Cajanus cajan]XP_020224717.1 probable choline kinase 2 [Cajanus cajan]